MAVAQGSEVGNAIVVRAHRPVARVAGALLRLVAAANVVYLGKSLASDMASGANSAPPVVVAIGLALFSGAPLALAFALGRWAEGRFSIDGEMAVLELRRERVQIPLASVSGVRPLLLPVPGPAIVLDLRSGKMFERSLESARLPDLVARLAEHVPAAKELAAHPIVAFAGARSRKASRVLLGIKLGVLPLVVSLVIFRLHQFIVYGGTFGQYYSLGLGPYLRSFFLRWLGIAGIFLVLAGVLRVVTESVVYSLTWVAPRRALTVRRVVEVVSLIVYFGGVPGYVVFRLLE